MEGYILLFFTLKKWYWKRQTSHLRQGGGSVECFIGIIIHTTVLLPVSTWADDSPTHPFQMSQPDLYFKNSFPSGGMNRDIEQRRGLTYIIRHSVQMRSWEMWHLNTSVQLSGWPGPPCGMRNSPGKEWDIISNLSQNFRTPEAGLHRCS